MIFIILFSILLLSFRLEWPERTVAAVFAIVFLFHEVAADNTNMVLYCSSDAAAACFLVVAFSQFEYSKFIDKLMTICALIIVLNFIGWALWYAGLPIGAVNWMFAALYSYIAFLTYRGPRHDRIFRFGMLRPVFLAHVDPGNNCNRGLQEEKNH